MKKDDLIGKYFPVLDHGFVALVDMMGDDQAVVQAARCSYGAGTKKANEDEGLIRYLRRHYHTTPFEQVVLKYHVKLPIFVARQLVRHRTASLNEYSLRYSLAPLLFYMPEYEVVRKQSAANRQGRGEQADRAVYDEIRNWWQELRLAASDTYQEALIEDIARELARIDLPLSLYTEWYWTIDLHNLFNFLRLRSDAHAQWEIQQYSNVKAGIVKALCPLSFQAFIDYQFAAVSFSRMERIVLQALLNGLPRGGGSMETECAELGMSVREVAEFREKLGPPKSPPSFDLDLESAKSAEWFASEAAGAVPDIEGKKQARLAR